jgi:hypothetical protein
LERKRTTPPRRPSWPVGVLTLILIPMLGFCGCRQSAPSDPTEGRKVLLTVLEAWKGGEKPAALAQRTPPIHVTDGDWMSGLRLQSFQADGGRLVGSDVSYDVVLELKTARGKVVKKNAIYAVTTRPPVLVLTQDSL